MNKKLVLNALLSVMVAFPMCFASCGDDDEDNTPDTPNTIVDNGNEQLSVVKIENGTLMGGKFSVSDDKQVYFSKGNLMKNGKSYSFAADQTTIIGEANIGGTIKDLMNWMDVSGMTIENNSWRCLSREEWNYLVTQRPNASSLCMYAQVMKNGVARRGSILFPDGFTMPDGYSSYRLGLEFNWREMDKVYKANNMSEITWNKFESQGALFLPHAGSCSGYEEDNWYMYKDESCGYWCSDHYMYVSYTASFGEYRFTCDYQCGLDFFNSFRLVRDVE